eukprot:gnl/MRDRNA2_/MRDRNA2_84451_c0_seq5.p1 gnl/MRDRNA2_/MRDRNA2_84451_c0~~gnl/MRDRNA2_/MRDRNA2_84451_c0_seq5.p1  ORF type:complete len:179 (+),score=40.76 gnl/MRDRNA2_/MRDRNA2_84451_c0_seq5:85-621(+)
MCKIACAIILGLVGQNLALTQKSAQQPLAVQGAPQQQQPNPFAATPFAFPGFGASAPAPAQQSSWAAQPAQQSSWAPSPAQQSSWAFPGFGAPAPAQETGFGKQRFGAPAPSPGKEKAYLGAQEAAPAPAFDFSKAFSDERAREKREYNSAIREAKSEIRKDALDIGRAFSGFMPGFR